MQLVGKIVISKLISRFIKNIKVRRELSKKYSKYCLECKEYFLSVFEECPDCKIQLSSAPEDYKKRIASKIVSSNPIPRMKKDIKARQGLLKQYSKYCPECKAYLPSVLEHCPECKIQLGSSLKHYRISKVKKMAFLALKVSVLFIGTYGIQKNEQENYRSGLSYFFQGRFSDAGEEFWTAVLVNPGYEFIKQNLSKIRDKLVYSKSGQTKQQAMPTVARTQQQSPVSTVRRTQQWAMPTVRRKERQGTFVNVILDVIKIIKELKEIDE